MDGGYEIPVLRFFLSFYISNLSRLIVTISQKSLSTCEIGGKLENLKPTLFAINVNVALTISVFTSESTDAFRTNRDKFS